MTIYLWLRIKKFFIQPWYKFHWRNIPFEIAYIDKIAHIKNFSYPDWLGTKLAEFDCGDKHYIIYLPK